MIADLKPYPDMKDSGVEWLGEVPGHWDVMPNRALFDEIKDRDCPDEEMLSVTIKKGVIRQAALLENSSKKDCSNLDRSNYKLVQPGDIVYNKMRAWQGAIGVSAFRGIVSPAYVVQRPKECGTPEYFHQLFQIPSFAKEAERWSYGITSDMWSLRPEHFKLIYSCLPPLPQQVAIVRYLDYVDRRVRKLVRVKRKLIELLIEQKQAIIHQAVTRGLDPDVPIKDSGVEWLGKVPAHWAVRQLGRIGRFSKGSGGTKEDEVADGVPCVRYGDLYMHHQYFVKRSRMCVTTKKAVGYTPIFYGDVLFAGSGETIEEIGKSAVNLISGTACCGGDVIIFRPSVDVDANFLGYATDCHQAAYQKSCMGRGITIMHIYSNDLKCLTIPLPPFPEQTAIVEYLNQTTADIETAIACANREIKLINEYRTRLITDVVTGKLDVREWSASQQVEEHPARKANVYFMRSVFAAEIVSRLHQEPTFGHVKFAKVLFLAERRCGVDLGSNYHRDAAGPYDSRALRSIDSQMKRQKWYEAKLEGQRYYYVPLERAGGHTEFYADYYDEVAETFDKVIQMVRKMDTKQCEIVATLYSAWEDLLKEGGYPTNDDIVTEVVENWHDAKRLIKKERWFKALVWMRENNFVPSLVDG